MAKSCRCFLIIKVKKCFTSCGFRKGGTDTSRMMLRIIRTACRDDICISNAQYSQLSAQQNLWCEILEF